MKGLEQVLPTSDNSNWRLNRHAEAGVAGGIGGHQLAGQRAHIPVSQIQLEALREIERGLNRGFVLRTGADDAGRGPDVAGMRAPLPRFMCR